MSSVRKSVIKSIKSMQKETAASRIAIVHSQNLLNSVTCRDVDRQLVKVRMYLWSTEFQPSSFLDSQ